MPVTLLYSGGYKGRIDVLEYDAEKVSLQVICSTLEGGEAPTWLCLSRDRRYLYAIDEWGEPEGAITAFEISSDGRTLKKLGSSISTQGQWPCHGELIPADESTGLSQPRLYCSNYQGQSIFSVSLNDDGTFAHESAQLVNVSDDGTQPGPHPGRQTQKHPHGTHVLRFPGSSSPAATDVVSLDQIFLVVPDLGNDHLRVFRVNQPDGKLEGQALHRLEAGSGPRHVIFDSVASSQSGNKAGRPRDTSCLVLQELSNSVSALSVTPPPTGSASTSRWPSFTSTQMDLSLLPEKTGPPPGLPPSFQSWHAAELALSPLLSPTGETRITTSSSDRSPPPRRARRYLLASNRASDHDPLNANKDPSALPPDSIAIFPVIDGQGADADVDTDDRAALRLDAERRVLVSALGRAPRHFEFAPPPRRRLESHHGGPSGSSGVDARDDESPASSSALLAIALHDTDEVVIAELVVEDDDALGVEGSVKLVEKARLKDAGRPGVVMWA